VRDLSYGEALLAVRWHEVQYACQQKVYPRRAFSEQMPGLPAGGGRVAADLMARTGLAVKEPGLGVVGGRPARPPGAEHVHVIVTGWW